MLDQAATFKHGNLRKFFAHLHAHHVTANSFTVAFFATAALDQLCIGTDN